MNTDLLNNFTEKEILNLKLSDLELTIQGSFIEKYISKLYSELEERNIIYKPHIWISSEWFTPDGIPGFAVPFYLLHPKLIKLEKKIIFEAEGSTEEECMKILRHETGHAIDHAYRFHFKKKWREVFGSFTNPYPNYYIPNPDSKDFVLHFNAWYAQAHPTEDFAETFSVWLDPNSDWKNIYKDWPALNKLEYIDHLMKEIQNTPPKNNLRIDVDPISEINITIKEHYDHKKEYYKNEVYEFYDQQLSNIFTKKNRNSKISADKFLIKNKTELRNYLTDGTGVHPYTIDQLIKEMIFRSKELNLYSDKDENIIFKKVIVMLTVEIMNVLHKGYKKRIAL